MIHDLEHRFASHVEMADKMVVNAISENFRSELCVFVPKSESSDFLGKIGLPEQEMKKISIEDEDGIKEFNDNSLTKILVIEENGVIVVRTRDEDLISSVISAYQLKEQQDGSVMSISKQRKSGIRRRLRMATMMLRLRWRD